MPCVGWFLVPDCAWCDGFAGRDDRCRGTGLKATLNHYRRTLTTLDSVDDFNPATFHALCQRIKIAPSGEATVIWKDGTSTPEQ